MKMITAHQLAQALAAQQLLVVDVREPAEHQAQAIAGSYLLPLATLRADQLPNTKQGIVLHCKAGKRSEQAYQQLITENPQLDLYSLEGGIEAWQQAGLPVETEHSR